MQALLYRMDNSAMQSYCIAQGTICSVLWLNQSGKNMKKNTYVCPTAPVRHMAERNTTMSFNHVCTPSHFSRVWLCVTLWTIARQAPLSQFPKDTWRTQTFWASQTTIQGNHLGQWLTQGGPGWLISGAASLLKVLGFPVGWLVVFPTSMGLGEQSRGDLYVLVLVFIP